MKLSIKAFLAELMLIIFAGIVSVSVTGCGPSYEDPGDPNFDEYAEPEEPEPPSEGGD